MFCLARCPHFPRVIFGAEPEARLTLLCRKVANLIGRLRGASLLSILHTLTYVMLQTTLSSVLLVYSMYR